LKIERFALLSVAGSILF